MSSSVNEPGKGESAAGSLEHGVLGVSDAIAQSVALLSLAIGVAFAASATAGDAGAAAPLTYVVAAVAALCLASVIVRFSRRFATVGGVYTYVAKGLGPEAGFLSGWIYGAGFAVGISFVLAISSTFLSTVFKVHTSLKIGWFAFFLILLAAMLVVALLEIRISTRTELVLGAVGVVAILLLSVIILAKGGDDGISLQPFNPSLLPSSNAFFLGLVLAFTGFIGFEAAAVLGEETANPRRAIPAAILGAVMFWRERGTTGGRYNPVLDIVLPAVAIVICGYTIYKSIVPAPPHPIDEAPYIAGIWIVIGIVVLLWLRSRNPDRVRRFGEALGEGEGA